ncbi:MAG: hypothetical protein EOO39_44725, partial [Cytophagaceae bacterium]
MSNDFGSGDDTSSYWNNIEHTTPGLDLLNAYPVSSDLANSFVPDTPYAWEVPGVTFNPGMGNGSDHNTDVGDLSGLDGLGSQAVFDIPPVDMQTFQNVFHAGADLYQDIGFGNYALNLDLGAYYSNDTELYNLLTSTAT